MVMWNVLIFTLFTFISVHKVVSSDVHTYYKHTKPPIVFLLFLREKKITLSHVYCYPIWKYFYYCDIKYFHCILRMQTKNMFHYYNII